MLVAAVVSAVVASCLMFQTDERWALVAEIGAQPGGGQAATVTASGARQARVMAQADPGTLVEDGEGVVWTAATASNKIFLVRYADPEGKTITVETADGVRTVAPGTDNIYRFAAENTLDEGVECTIEASVDVSAPDTDLPIEGRVKSASGYLAGDDDTWVLLSDMGVLQEGVKLGPRQSAAYSLEWRWPFERGEGDELAANDLADTAIGNREAQAQDVQGEDISVDVTLRVIASYDEGGARPGAYGLPTTRDLLQPLLFALSALLALGAAIVLLVNRPRKRNEDGE